MEFLIIQLIILSFYFFSIEDSPQAFYNCLGIMNRIYMDSILMLWINLQRLIKSLSL